MQINQYLIISPGSKSYRPKVKLVASLSGTMPSNAIALKLNITLPDTLFKKPMLEASIHVNEADVTKPIITAQTLDNIKQVLNQNFGVDMNIQVVEQKSKK